MNQDGETDFDSDAYRDWLKQCEAFRMKGHLVHADEDVSEVKGSDQEAEQYFS